MAGLTKEQYVNTIGYVKVHLSRIQSSSSILFDKNSTEQQRETAKIESQEAVQKMCKLLNTLMEKEGYEQPMEKYSDEEMRTMRIF